MSASSALLTDTQSLITNGPSTLTKAASIAAAGPIMDYIGNTRLVQLKLQKAVQLLTACYTNTSSSDDTTNRTLLAAVIAALNGTSAPSTTLITDMQTAITNGPSTLTKAACIAAAGAIMDYVGCTRIVRRVLEEANVLLGAIKTNTSNSDDSTNLTLINNLLLALA